MSALLVRAYSTMMISKNIPLPKINRNRITKNYDYLRTIVYFSAQITKDDNMSNIVDSQ